MDLASSAAVRLGKGDGTFQPPLNFPGTIVPGAIVPGDFDHDGKFDLARTNRDAGSVGILLGKGDGTFQSAGDYAAGAKPAGIVTSDLNRDGHLDLAVANGTYQNSMISVLLGIGNGTFRAAVSYQINAVNAASTMLATGEFNGDGKIDLVVANGNGSNYLTVFLGNGDGTFQPPIDTFAAGPQTLVPGDFDRDGKLDVAFMNGFAVILLGNGDGTFRSGPYYSLNFPLDVRVADFNGDGRIDLVAIGIFKGKNVRVFLGNGDGSFQDAGYLMDNVSGVAITVGDFDRDTRPDLAASVSGGLALLRNVTPGNSDNPDYFVHQHYLDFLAREPDANGFSFWNNQITSCGANQQCVEEKRINVSAAFSLSIEFQRTVYLVERTYKTAYGDATGTSTFGGLHQLAVPIVRLNELLMDTETIGQGAIVGQEGWDIVLENNRQNFFTQFVQRSRFTAAFPTTLAPAEFVDKLNQNAGNVPSTTEQSAAIALFNNAVDTANSNARAQALRLVAEDEDLYRTEFNRAFVLTEYFGYLRRNPDEGPDSDFSGYNFWLNKLNSFNGDFLKAEMVKAFINSNEYRKRFAP